ncbi:MAG: TIGR00730 family Rossman fold protein [Planctomycetota bacterium]
MPDDAGKSICVYLGARPGEAPHWAEAAAHAGRTIAERGHTLVYGGGKLGLMGILADAALDAGGRVVGVIPEALVEREQIHRTLHENHVVKDMHARKSKLVDLADAFLVLPGGFGTLDELFEAITWRQLDFHAKPIALWSVQGYYDALWQFLSAGRQHGFMPDETFRSLRFDEDLTALLDQLVA